MPKRKLAALDSDSTTLTSRSRGQKFFKPAERFIWKPREWRQVRSITPGVTVLAKKENRQLIVIKKVVRTYKDDVDEAGGMPFEVRALNFLPDCNRIAKPLFVSLFDPDSSHSTIFYKHHPLGDLSDWKKRYFDDKNRKTVPESHIWRFFLQIGQALAAIHNELGPSRKDGYALLHRDIKPGNILVVDNGTTYPSFKLNDFDCAMLFDPAKAGRASLVGTFKWQPPENPKICTKAADVWSLGACVHYLATNHAPTEDFLKYKTTCLAEDEKVPSSAQGYNSDDRYYQARVPRHVTSINIGDYHYSDELDGWMATCLNFSPRRRPKAGKLVEKMWDTATEMLQHFGGKSALVDLDVKFDASA